MFRILTLFVFTTTCLSQSSLAAKKRPAVLWTKQFAAGSAVDGAKDVAVDSENNAVVCGQINSKGFVRKYSPQGELLWDFRLNDLYSYAKGNQDYTYVASVAVDEEDFIYYAGRARNSGHDNFCYGKLSPVGEMVDSYRHERNRGSACYDMAKGDGMMAIGGFVYAGMGKKSRQTSNTFIGLLDYELKLKRRKDNDRSKTATSKWARGEGTKIVTGVAFTSDGGLAVAGRDGTSGDGHRYLQRRASNLGAKWTQRLAYQGWFKSEKPRVAVDSQDAIFVSMSSNEKGETDDNFYVAKYSPKGEFLWEVSKPTSKPDYASGMVVTATDSVLVACKYFGKAAVADISSNGVMADRPFSLFPRKVADSGAAEAIALANDGTFYVVGTMTGQLVEGEIPNNSSSSGPWAHYGGKPHGFILKLSWDGTKPPEKMRNVSPEKLEGGKRTLFD